MSKKLKSNFMRQYYQSIKMLKSHQGRLACSSVRTKRSQSAPIQQIENQGKQYRTLLAIFATNVNFMIKLNHSCLGETQSYPKIKVNREELQPVIQQLEKIYMKMEDKMTKDAINRNANIKKSQDQYTDLFKAYFPDWKMTKKIDKQLKNEETYNQDYASKEYLSQRKKISIDSTFKRPQSSKERKYSRSNLFNQIYRNFQASQICQTYKLKTISAYFNQNPEVKKQQDFAMDNHSKLNKIPSRAKKTFTNYKNRYQHMQSEKQKEYQQFLFKGQEIIRDQRKSKENPNEYESQSFNIPSSRKNSTNRMINLKCIQSNTINQMEKMQIQNRIRMINSALSVNLVQPQGYRPKSRCWQNYFN